MGDLTNNFSRSEFACPCCGEVEYSVLLVSMLQVARDTADRPFRITSGYRCANRNAAVGGVPESAHTRGLAVDISCGDSRARFDMLRALFSAGFRRIGIGTDFIHVDVDEEKVQSVVWGYAT